MDINSLLSTVLSSDSVNQLSQTTNVSAQGVQSVLGSALPSLLNGALAQSNGADTAESFAGALTQHSADDTSDLAAFLSKVDLQDGGKIVGCVGQRLAAILTEEGTPLEKLYLCNLGKRFPPHGSVKQLREAFHIDAASIAAKALEVVR